jgi:hypothetical protein
MMAMSSALVGAAPSMFAWYVVVATMIASGRSYWEHFLVHQTLQREMLLGDKVQNMLAQLTLQQFSEGE